MSIDFVTQSTWRNPARLHVALIMDGNGRWAAAQGLPRWAGHTAGLRTVRRVVEAAPRLGVGTLTLYAFSADNWKRPPAEVDFLMRLLEQYLSTEANACRDRGVRLNVIGRRDRLDPRVVTAIERAEATTLNAARLLVRVAIDYSSRQAIVETTRSLRSRSRTDIGTDFYPRLERVIHSVPEVPPVDLLIRTSGEQRLSDFLLWESAYAELHFTSIAWPDFQVADLADAIAEYARRDRRFGALSEPQPVSARQGGVS